MKKEVMEYMMAVNFLIDSLEFMIEEGEYNEDKLLKRIEVVNKFKTNLDKIIK